VNFFTGVIARSNSSPIGRKKAARVIPFAAFVYRVYIGVLCLLRLSFQFGEEPRSNAALESLRIMIDPEV